MADLHFFAPWDFERFCGNKYNLDMKDADRNWGCGQGVAYDFRKRFNSATFQKKFKLEKHRIDKFLEWLDFAVLAFNQSEYCGANMVYKITRGE